MIRSSTIKTSGKKNIFRQNTTKPKTDDIPDLP